MEKWTSGDSVLYRNSALRLEKSLPGTLETFDLPAFELLADRPLPESRVATLLESYRRRGEGAIQLLPWQFPDEALRMSDKTMIPVMHEADTANLFRYGTIHSFSAILGIVRAAGARGESSTLLSATKDLYRALPVVLKLPWFAEHRDQLIEQIETIRARDFLTFLLFDVDWEVINRQIADTEFEPVRERRKWDRATARFAELEDPILEADIISGREVQRRRLRNEARRRKKMAADTEHSNDSRP
jgi:hypothetical protein